MNNECVEYCPTDSYPKLSEKDKIKVSKLKLIYQNSANPRKEKSSGMSSDEETTSSSLLPLPGTLRHMRTELKNNPDSFAEEYSRHFGVPGYLFSCTHMHAVVVNGNENVIESPVNRGCVLEDPTGQFSNSLHELRKKYTLKSENSVAMKVNSANLMLDDILNSSNVKRIPEETLHQNFFKEEGLTAETNHETDTSKDSVSNTKQFNNMTIAPVLTFPSCELSPAQCPTHGNNFQPVWKYSNFSVLEKAPQNPELDNNKNKRKNSLLEKIHNLHFKYKINSVYKVMQKPFNKEKTKLPNDQQGIPGVYHQCNVSGTKEFITCKCGVNSYLEKQYPKKMLLDLVESSELSESDYKSMDKGEGQCPYPSETKCTCFRRECACPEVIPRCVCFDYKCKTPELACGNLSRTDPSHPPQPNKDNETESESPLSPYPNTQPVDTDKKIHCHTQRQLIERTDIYYFDHGNSAYYRTTDNHPVRYTECLVERTDEYATKFWAEFFGAIEIGVAFLVSFILQLYRFLFTSIIRALTVGLIQIFSDYFIKPILTIIFNGIIQPCLILVYNIATSLRDLFLPISQIFGFFAKEIASIIRSCRLVDINRESCKQSCNCGNKV